MILTLDRLTKEYQLMLITESIKKSLRKQTRSSRVNDFHIACKLDGFTGLKNALPNRWTDHHQTWSDVLL